MQNSSPFQFLAIDTIQESSTNPRRTFEEAKLHELAASIRQHGLIQPLTVRPNARGFEIVAGARRFRAAQLAELFSVPARIVDIDDAQALEWQLVENSQRVDVHPYEEAQGFERLLDIPGYDVATLVEKSGKSASHIYARLSLLQLIPEVAQAFSQDRVTASHANLIARLPREAQAGACAQCWRKDWQDKEAHLLSAKHLAAWIQANLYLSLADAPFDREDPTLNPDAGACSACPRRTGYNTALFADAVSDECMDGACYRSKIASHIDRHLAANHELIQIENGWCPPKEHRPGAVQRGHFRELEPTADNTDAEPVVPCDAAHPAIIVYGKRIGTTLTVCTDEECPVHNPPAAAHMEEAQPEPAVSVMDPKPEEPSKEERQEAQEHEQRRKEHREEEERKAEERQREFERRQEEFEARRVERDEIVRARAATFDRIVSNAPATFTAAQLRLVLRALVSGDEYLFGELASEFADAETTDEPNDGVLLSVIERTADDKLAALTLAFALTQHKTIPREGETDFLAEAALLFAPAPPKTARPKKTKATTPIKPAAPKRKPSKKQVAA